MSEATICFLAVEGSPHIEQAPAFCASILKTLGAIEGLKVIGVAVNGVGLKFRAIDPCTVAVSPPIPFNGSRVALHCTSPMESLAGFKEHPAPYPPPREEYGLQRPVGPRWRLPHGHI